MKRPARIALRLSIAAVFIAAAAPARAIPAFARKYGTSCLTCHTVYPRLTPFGEAFRRNGYRFPGIDSDYVKQETVALGQEQAKKSFPNQVWPATIPISIPIAVGANGELSLYPDKGASVPRQNNDTRVALDSLVAEAHLWSGAALSDTFTTWAELTIADGGADVEHAQLLFEDLLGPKHAVNLVVGKGFPTLMSFGPHSTYAADAAMPNVPVTGIYGLSADPFTLLDNYSGLELNGVIAGRADYSIGWSAGKNSFGSVFDSANFYAHAGYKAGGMRLDGEGSSAPADPMKPWAEDAVTVDVFAYRSNEHFPTPGVTDTPTADVSVTLGAHVRGQLGSAELDLGYYGQSHDRGTASLDKVRADVAFGELSYVVFPWMVPTLRVETISLKPTGGTRVTDVHVMPGIAFLVRANVKAVLVLNFESANGFPQDAGGNPLAWDGGSADWGPFVLAPKATSTPGSSLSELESIGLFVAWAL